MLLAMTIQGCGGGSGGGNNEPGNAANVAGKPTALGAGVNEQMAEVGVHPTSGPSGSTVAISGRGFADACGVNLFLGQLGGESLAEALINDGSFAVQAVLPEALTSGELVIVGDLLESDGQECTQSTGATFETTFDVTGGMPIITLALPEGRPGTEVGIEGRGFCGDPECSAVRLLIDGQVAATGVAVEDDGTFSTGAFVPAIDAAGAVAVVATQTDADGMELRGFGELIVTVRPNEEPPVVQ
jgi:hypothetical protein